MDKKYYVTRTDRNGEKVYKKAKTLDIWSKNPDVCWKYSKQGAKQIVERLTEYDKKLYHEHFIYDFEEVIK